MSLYKIIPGLLLAGTLALNTGCAIDQKSTSQEKVEQERTEQKKEENLQNEIHSERPELSAVGDGIALKEYIHRFSLTPDSEINLYEKFGLKAGEASIYYEVVDAKTGLKNIISYLEKGLESRDTQSKKEKQASIKYYRGLLAQIPGEESESYRRSLSNLEKSVREGVISGKDVDDGFYILVGKSKTTKGYAENSIPIIVDIKNTPEKLYFPESENSARIVGEVVYTKKLMETGKEGVLTKRLVETDKKSVIDPTKERKEKKSKKPLSTKLLVDGMYGKNGLKGASIGIGYGPFVLSVNYSNSGDKIVKEIEVPLSNGRQGVGIVKDLDFNSLGIGVEAYVNKILFLGAGINSWTYTNSVLEEIVSSNGDVLKSNTDSKSGKETSGRFYGGLDIPISKVIGVRAMCGYDTKKGVWGGIGGRFKLGKKPDKK